MEPLAPSAVREGSGESRLPLTRRSGRQSPGFLSRLNSDYRLRQLDDNENDPVGDNVVDDEEVSEQDDVQSERDRHNSTRSNLDEDAQDALRNEEVVQVRIGSDDECDIL